MLAQLIQLHQPFWIVAPFTHRGSLCFVPAESFSYSATCPPGYHSFTVVIEMAVGHVITHIYAFPKDSPLDKPRCRPKSISTDQSSASEAEAMTESMPLLSTAWQVCVGLDCSNSAPGREKVPWGNSVLHVCHARLIWKSSTFWISPYVLKFLGQRVAEQFLTVQRYCTPRRASTIHQKSSQEDLGN